MNPLRLLKKIVRTGRIAEAAPSAPTPIADSELRSALNGSVQVRHVDTGSCNGCEIEIGAAFGGVYDVERYGVRLVASPRHADVLAVTGVVTYNMVEPLVRTVEATPKPRLIVAIGDCAHDCGLFAGAYGVAGSVSDVVDVDLCVPGCPPHPSAIVEALRQVSGR